MTLPRLSLGRVFALSGLDMAIHFCNSFIHVYGGEEKVRVSILEYDKDLVRKALPHPFQSLKIKNDLFKIL